ncbi:hypothetical protein ABZW30_42370 [Kitasatospora sp. NPDC004669]|uniref:TRADD-N-associated membrane domain-containing protein n=1 Tax=Kitasatospora sp. NPDC004669 TaxID=3154555 RepID=UPI0033A76EAF
MKEEELAAASPGTADGPHVRSGGTQNVVGVGLKLRVGLTLAGIAVALISPQLRSFSDTPLEDASTSWAQVIGYLLFATGVVWQGFDLLIKKERERAKRVIEGGNVYRAEGDLTIHVHGDEPRTGLSGTQAADAFAARQERMLEDSYAQGIFQARVTFWVSTFFLCLGALILFAGVASAVLSGGSKGKVEAGIVAAVAGTVSSLLSGIFLYQSNRSRDSVIEQASRMQARSLADRRITVVRDIANSIEEADERTQARRELLTALIGSLGKLDDRQVAELPISGRFRTPRPRRPGDAQSNDQGKQGPA